MDYYSDENDEEYGEDLSTLIAPLVVFNPEIQFDSAEDFLSYLVDSFSIIMQIEMHYTSLYESLERKMLKGKYDTREHVSPKDENVNLYVWPLNSFRTLKSDLECIHIRPPLQTQIITLLRKCADETGQNETPFIFHSTKDTAGIDALKESFEKVTPKSDIEITQLNNCLHKMLVDLENCFIQNVSQIFSENNNKKRIAFISNFLFVNSDTKPQYKKKVEKFISSIQDTLIKSLLPLFKTYFDSYINFYGRFYPTTQKNKYNFIQYPIEDPMLVRKMILSPESIKYEYEKIQRNPFSKRSTSPSYLNSLQITPEDEEVLKHVEMGYIVQLRNSLSELLDWTYDSLNNSITILNNINITDIGYMIFRYPFSQQADPLDFAGWKQFSIEWRSLLGVFSDSSMSQYHSKNMFAFIFQQIIEFEMISVRSIMLQQYIEAIKNMCYLVQHEMLKVKANHKMQAIYEHYRIELFGMYYQLTNELDIMSVSLSKTPQEMERYLYSLNISPPKVNIKQSASLCLEKSIPTLNIHAYIRLLEICAYRYVEDFELLEEMKLYWDILSLNREKLNEFFHI